MKRILLFAMTLATIAGAGVGNAETATPDAPFRFELAETNGHRGLGVAGYVYNGLPWRITNVRLRVESVDPNGTVTASWSLVSSAAIVSSGPRSARSGREPGLPREIQP